jgi:hypothetical protein
MAWPATVARRLLLAALVAALSDGRAAHASVTASDPTQCLDSLELEYRLRKVLERAARTDLEVSAIGERAPDAHEGSIVTLRVVDASGETLVRHFTILPADCPSASRLLETVLERYVAELPRPTIEPPPKKASVTTATSSFGMELGVAGEGGPPGDAYARLIALGVYGRGDHHFVGSLHVRQSVKPQGLGMGQFFETFVLAGAGWRYSVSSAALVGAEVRAGTLSLVGTGYDRNRVATNAWFEFALHALFTVGPIRFGAEVSASPEQQVVGVNGVLDQATISNIRLGLLLLVPILGDEN